MTDFRYFRSVEGRAFIRPGTGLAIGAKLVKGTGYVWDTERVVPIPALEVQRNLKTWQKAKERGDIIEVPPPLTAFDSGAKQ